MAKTSAKTRMTSSVNGSKIAAIENMLRVLKADEYRLLTNYMYLAESDLKVYVDITEEGEYVLTVRAITDRLIDVGEMLV